MTGDAPYKFRLYIADHTTNSEEAIANLGTLCRDHLPERHEIELVDVLQQPQRALADGVLMTPTLVKLEPLPVRRIVGTLGRTDTVLRALGLRAAPA